MICPSRINRRGRASLSLQWQVQFQNSHLATTTLSFWQSNYEFFRNGGKNEKSMVRHLSLPQLNLISGSDCKRVGWGVLHEVGMPKTMPRSNLWASDDNYMLMPYRRPTLTQEAGNPKLFLPPSCPWRTWGCLVINAGYMKRSALRELVLLVDTIIL